MVAGGGLRRVEEEEVEIICALLHRKVEDLRNNVNFYEVKLEVHLDNVHFYVVKLKVGAEQVHFYEVKFAV